jgi:hypothetical protein
MIRGIFHAGSGLGNQLHRYVATRCLALEKGEDFGMVAPDLFKGASFINLDMGHVITDYEIEYPAGKVITNVETIDGEFQSESVWEKHIDKVREWLKVEPLKMPDDVCVINFRGVEYTLFPDLFLTKEYWDKAVGMMKEKYPDIRFEVHTDDIETASKFFPEYPIIRDIGLNWRSIRYAKHLILSNSSFAILPALLNEAIKEIIAPKYWAGHNVKEWKTPENYYRQFTYI